MIAGSHFPTYDFDNNRDFAVDDPEVINELMNTEIIAGTPPCPKYVHAKVARAAEPQEIFLFSVQDFLCMNVGSKTILVSLI